jgi:hypothetical protein
MFQTILADMIILPAVVFLVARFSHRKQEPEWVELNHFRAYLRSPEFRKKNEKLIETYLKGGGDNG